MCIRDSIKVLDNEELKAVIIHEVAHSKNRIMRYLSSFTESLWLFGISSAFTVYTLSFIYPVADIKSGLYLLSWLLFIPIVTVLAIVSSWISEHEADMNAVEKVGVAPFMRALIKHELLSDMDLKPFIRQIKFNDITKIEISADARWFRKILSTLLKYSLVETPKDAITFMLRPTFPTHPPTIFRYLKIVSSMSSKR